MKNNVLKLVPLVILLVLLFVLTSCTKPPLAVTDELYALDTKITFTVYAEEAVAENAIEKSKQEITRLEKMLSASQKGSDISRLNLSKGEKTSVSAETYDLISRAIAVSDDLDNKSFDITVRPLISLWGFDTKNYRVPGIDEINKAKEYVNYRDIQLYDNDSIAIKKGMSIDLGAIAKGYIADRVSSVLKKNNIQSAIVSLGGNIVSIGTKNGTPFKIGIEYPDESHSVFASVDSFCSSAVTSGAYQRYFEENGKKYHHIIDPKTGYPSQSDISSVTVFNDNSALSDALSTAFFVMGTKDTISYCKSNNIDIALLSDDYTTLYVTKRVAKTLSLFDEYSDIKVEVIS